MKGIRIRPEKQGLRATLFDLEADIMEVVWSKGWSEFPVADVHKELARQREIAYTTVMTTVGRLYKKGLLHRIRDGRRYLYQAKMTRSAFTEAMAREVLGSFSGLEHKQALALLVDEVSGADVDELTQLEDLIRKRKKALGL